MSVRIRGIEMTTHRATMNDFARIRDKVANMRVITEHQRLQAMDLDERLEWMRGRIRYRVGMCFLRVDGHLIAGEEDLFEDMLARFLMVIARPGRVPVKRNEWQG